MLTALKQKIYFLLRRSEKWTETDMVYLAKGGFWLTGDKIIGMATAFILAIVYANWLPQETYGVFKYVLSISSLFIIATLPSMNIALTRAVAIGYEGSAKTIVKIKTKFTLLGIAAGVVLSVYYFVNHNPVLGACFLITAIIYPLAEARFVYGAYLAGKKLFKVTAIYSAVFQIFLTLALVATLFFYQNVIFLIFVYFAANFAVNFTLNYITFKKYPANTKDDPATLSFGKHLSVMDVITLISDQIDKILMWHFLGPVQLAIYSYATLPITQLESFFKSITTMAFPKLAAQGTAVLKTTLTKKMVKSSIALLIPFLLYFLFCKYIYQIFFPEYIDAVKYAQYYAVAILFFPQRLFGTAITAQAHKKYLYILKTILPLIKIGLMAVFIPLYGVGGAVTALLLTLAASGIISYWFFKKL